MLGIDLTGKCFAPAFPWRDTYVSYFGHHVSKMEYAKNRNTFSVEQGRGRGTQRTLAAGPRFAKKIPTVPKIIDISNNPI
jgi:hypothetical protein